MIQLILRERIGFATLFDALITGRLTQFFIDISPYPEKHSLWLGIGTVISTFGAGAVMHLFFDVIGFEPRKLEHKSLTESLAQLFKKV